MNHSSLILSRQNQPAGLPRSFRLHRVKRTKWESALWLGYFIAGCVGFKIWYTDLEIRSATEAQWGCLGPCCPGLENLRRP